MDYNAINTIISKAFFKEQKIILGDYDDKTVGITIDGLVMWFIPENIFLFDKDKLLKDRKRVTINRYVKTEGYTDAVRTNELISFDKKTLAVFKNDDTEVYVDLKLLKVFDPRVSSYKIKNATSGVLVYEGDELVGFVMPTRYTKK